MTVGAISVVYSNSTIHLLNPSVVHYNDMFNLNSEVLYKYFLFFSKIKGSILDVFDSIIISVVTLHWMI